MNDRNMKEYEKVLRAIQGVLPDEYVTLLATVDNPNTVLVNTSNDRAPRIIIRPATEDYVKEMKRIRGEAHRNGKH